MPGRMSRWPRIRSRNAAWKIIRKTQNGAMTAHLRHCKGIVERGEAPAAPRQGKERRGVGRRGELQIATIFQMIPTRRARIER